MNIFYLHSNPKTCAQYHNDNHVVKMQLESAQLLCSAHLYHNNDAPYNISKGQMNHPCAIWVRKSLSNYKWLCQLGLELLQEHKFRYEKPSEYITKASEVIKWCMKNLPNIPDKGFTAPELAMPNEYKHQIATIAYKSYYVGDKQFYIKQDKKIWYTWRKRGVPTWFRPLKNSPLYK